MLPYYYAGCYLTRNKILSVRMLSTVWCLMAIIIISYYNSMFISYLTVPKHEPLTNTLEELARSKTKCVIVEKGSVTANMLLVWDKLLLFLRFLDC